MEKIFRIINIIMGSLFLFAVVVQYNDPDAVWWMLIYGAAALCSILRLSGWFMESFSLTVLAIALTRIIHEVG